MNTYCLRRSLLALSVTAAVFNTPTSFAADLNYDLSGGPLSSAQQNWQRVTLTGTANITPVSAPGLTYAAQFKSLTAQLELVNTGSITMDDATHGIGIDIGPGLSGPSTFGYNIRNTGSIKIDGLASIGDSRGIVDTGSTLGGSFINTGDIEVSGMNSSGVILLHTTMQGISNDGTISASGTDALGMLLDGATLTGTVSNNGTLRASGTDAEALTFEAVTFNHPTGTGRYMLINDGTISGESIGVHVSDQPTNSRPFTIYQLSGLIEGGSAAIQVDDGESYFDWFGGTVRGDILGMSGVLIDGDVVFDGSNINSDYVTIQSGKLTLMKPHTTLIGDFDMEESDSVLEMYLGNDTNPNLPVLRVTGTTDIAPGGRIHLQARSSDFRITAGGTRYTLISSDQLTGGENLTVTSSSALLDVKSFGIEGNDVKALVAAKSEEVLTQNTLQAGGTRNAAGALGRFSSFVMPQLNEQDSVFQAFANAGTDTELAKLAEKLSPDVSRGVIHAATNSQTLVSNVISDRSSRNRTTGSSTDKGVWLQSLTSDADQDARKGMDGFDANSHGIAVGADGQLNVDTVVGLAYSYINTDVKSDEGSKTEVTGHALTLYGNWTHDNWFVDSSLMYGWNDNESRRYIVGTRAKGDYDSEIFGVNALAGYSFHLNPDVVLEPQVGARYANVGMDAYREKGSSASLNVGSQRYEVGEMGIGARLAAALDVGQGSLEPEAKVMAWHDFIGDKTATTSSFVLGGDSFTTRGTTPVRDSYEVGLGANYRLGSWSVGGSYNYVTSTDFNADTFTAKVRYAF